jgi:hypothetical protein
MAKRTTPRYEPEPQPAEATNDDILTAVRRVEKTLVAMTKDIADLSDDVEHIHGVIVDLPQAQRPPNDGPNPLPGVPIPGYNNPKLPKGL